MKRKQWHHQGAVSELRAAIWLLNQGYEVFRNVSAHGPMDLVAIKGQEILRLDVKTLEKHISSFKLTPEQGVIGVLPLNVSKDGTDFRIDTTPRLKENKILFCENCGRKFTATKGDVRQRFCTRICKAQAQQKRIRQTKGK
jgi:hypothetical protein